MKVVKCSFLESGGHLSVNNIQLLAELLFEAQRIDLLTAIGITTEDFKIMVGEHGHQLTPYRYV